MWNKNTIRRARMKLKLTQKAFAAMLGTTQQMISEWETGVHVPKNAYSQLLTMKFGKPYEKECKESSEEGSKEAGSEKES